MGINKVFLLGNLGRDPEIRRMESGNNKASFPLATSERYKNKDGEYVTQTEWHNIVIWGALVDVVEKYVKKGSQIHIIGKNITRSFQDKNTGATRYIAEVIGKEIELLGRPNSQQTQEGTEANNPNPQTHNNIPETETDNSSTKDTDGLPF